MLAGAKITLLHMSLLTQELVCTAGQSSPGRTGGKGVGTGGGWTTEWKPTQKASSFAMCECGRLGLFSSVVPQTTLQAHPSPISTLCERLTGSSCLCLPPLGTSSLWCPPSPRSPATWCPEETCSSQGALSLQVWNSGKVGGNSTSAASFTWPLSRVLTLSHTQSGLLLSPFMLVRAVLQLRHPLPHISDVPTPIKINSGGRVGEAAE